MTHAPNAIATRSRESTRARWLFATSLLVIGVMLIAVFHTSQEPDMRSPHDTFWAVMRALNNHDQAALQRLTTSQGYIVITAHMKDNSAASYMKLRQSMQSIVHYESYLLKDTSLFSNYIGFSSGGHVPIGLKLGFRRGIRGWELDNIRGYELEPLIRKEKGVPVIPSDPDVVPNRNLGWTQTS